MDRLYGRNPIYESLRAGRRTARRLRVAQSAEQKGRLQEIIDLARQKGVKVEQVPRQQLDALGSHHQGVELETSDYPYSTLNAMLQKAEEEGRPPFMLVLDTMQDPQNLGTLLRTAELVGVHGVILPLARTATITPAVVSASSGATEHILIGQSNLAQALREMKEADIWAVGLDGSEDAQPPERVRLDGAIALVVGNEGEGMRRLVREHCDLLLRLPMRGQLDSLNAAVAGSVALYLAWQARGFDGG